MKTKAQTGAIITFKAFSDLLYDLMPIAAEVKNGLEG